MTAPLSRRLAALERAIGEAARTEEEVQHAADRIIAAIQEVETVDGLTSDPIERAEVLRRLREVRELSAR